MADAVSTEALAGDPFGMAVSAAVRNHVKRHGEPWEGSATDLLGKVTPDGPGKSWPRDATRASGHLRRIAPLLRASGITVAETPRTSKGRKFRLGVAPTPENSNIPASSAASASRMPSELRIRDDASYDAGPAAASSALHGHDAGDADIRPASPTYLADDLRKRHGHDARDADDAVVLPISGRTPSDVPPGAAGPCVTCHRTTRRYGPGGNPKCAQCREAS